MAGTDVRGVLSSDSRLKILTLVRAASQPVRVGEIGELTGLHTNTVREHLNHLVAAGLVSRFADHGQLLGRPQWLYAAVNWSDNRDDAAYRDLAVALASFIQEASQTPVGDAERAGRAWGGQLAATIDPTQSVSPVQRLVDCLDALGFAPELDPDGFVVRLRRCSMREAASRRPEVVCAVHLGLVRGLLDGIDAPITAERLDPWVTPSLCVLTLASRRRRSAAHAGRSATSPDSSVGEDQI